MRLQQLQAIVAQANQAAGSPDADLMDESWFESDFPDGMELRHAFAIHKLLFDCL